MLMPPTLAASCDKCNFNEAYFYQLQIRSADEPMTTCKSSFIFGEVTLSYGFVLTVYRYVLYNPRIKRLLTNVHMQMRQLRFPVERKLSSSMLSILMRGLRTYRSNFFTRS